MGLQRTSIAIAVVIVGAVGLYYLSGDSTDQSQERKDIYSDSIAAPDRPTFTAQVDTHDTSKASDQPKVTAGTDTQDTMPKPSQRVGEDFAPGTALIKATILSVELVDSKSSKVVVNVDEVMGYGSATSPIPTGTEISVDVSNLLANNPDKRNLIQEGTEIEVLIASEQGMRSDNAQEWTAIEIK